VSFTSKTVNIYSAEYLFDKLGLIYTSLNLKTRETITNMKKREKVINITRERINTRKNMLKRSEWTTLKNMFQETPWTEEDNWNGHHHQHIHAVCSKLTFIAVTTPKYGE
jgi:hypothetical protein